MQDVAAVYDADDDETHVTIAVGPETTGRAYADESAFDALATLTEYVSIPLSSVSLNVITYFYIEYIWL